MSEEEKPLESVVFEVVGSYLGRKMERKHGKEWKEARKTEEGKEDWNEKRGDLARSAFLAVRSRTGADFIEYFVSTLCSVHQFLPEERFLLLAKQLYAETDRVRTLTMLALSARS